MTAVAMLPPTRIFEATHGDSPGRATADAEGGAFRW